MLDRHRNLFSGFEKIIGKTFGNLLLTPNQYTALSIVAILGCDYFLVKGGYWLALAFFAAAAFLDFIDGAVARVKNLSTKKGAYWDTVADRYVEILLLFGLLFVNLPDFYVPSYVWIFLALAGSMMTTYAKAAAKEKGLSNAELKGGLMSRAERLFLMLAILIVLNFTPYWATVLLAVFALLANITAVWRIAAALKTGN